MRVWRPEPALGRASTWSIRKSGKIAKVSDPIGSVSLKGGDGSVSSIDGGSEEDKILGLVEQVKKLDPDLVFTSDGDSFVLPYLAARAAANGISDRLSIDRDGSVLEAPAKKGTSYFSYGKILFKPSAMKLRGRVHLDTSSSFVCRESGLEGFYEVSRVCRLPLHTASRASIGKALSSLQFYHATKEGILIPWKPVLAESFKSRAELLVADRGGFIFEPELGVHEGVGELDFQQPLPQHHDEEEHLGGDGEVLVLPRLGEQDPRARLERVREAAGGDSPEGGEDHSGEEDEVQEAGAGHARGEERARYESQEERPEVGGCRHLRLPRLQQREVRAHRRAHRGLRVGQEGARRRGEGGREEGASR